MLENNLIISGVEEPKFEEEGPYHDKLDIIIAKTLPGKQTKKSLKRQRSWT